MAAEVEQKLAAILAADVAGYTRLMAEDEPATIATIADYRTIFRRHIEANGGRVVDMAGDSILAVFTSAAGAVKTAVDAQSDLTDRNEKLPGDRRMHFRVGVNLGDIREADDGAVYGDGVNVAARLESLAKPGGVMLSEDAWHQVRRDPEMSFADSGLHDVKNVAEPVRAYRLLAGDEPPPKSMRLRLSLLAVLTIVVLGVAGIIGWQASRSTPVETASVERMAYPLPEEPSIAVLPFDNLSGNSEHDSIADGLSENIIAVLSQARGMMVIARSSTFTYKGKPVKTQQVAEELGVRYVLEGSVQVSGQSLRVTAQLIDALTGSHIWSERFDRALSDVFAVQDEITLEVVTALQVELTEGPQAVVWRGGTDSLEAWTLYLRGLVLLRRFTKEDNLRARALFEKAVAIDRDFVLGWVYVGHSLSNAVRYGWSSDPEADWRRVEEVGRMALDIDSEYPDTYTLLAIHAALHGDAEQSIALARKSVEFGPGNSVVTAIASAQFMWAGQLDEALALMLRAMRLSPHYPAWYALFLARIQNSLGNYEESIRLAEQAIARMPESITWGHPELLHGLARVGRLDEAKNVLEEALARDPEFSIQAHRERQQRCCPWTAELMEERQSALRLVGVPERPPSAEPSRPVIAVLPFDNMSGDPEQDYFVDGLTEEVIAALTRADWLGVISHGSAFKFRSRDVDAREAGRELGAAYVVEGSVRKVSETIRVTVRLLDVESGANLWAETYEKQLTAENIFAVQDKVTHRIVATLADTYGVIARDELDDTSGKRTADLSVYDCLLRHNEYRRVSTAETHIVARDCLELTVERDPDYAEAWARLSHVYVEEYSMGMNARPERYDALERGYEAAQKAAGLDPSNQRAHLSLARAYFFRRDFDAFSIAMDRAIALNPNHADMIGTAGYYLAYAGEWDRGIALIERAIALNPYHPSWYTEAFVDNHYRQGEFEAALRRAHQINLPDNWWTHMVLAACYAQLGRDAEARQAAARMVELHPTIEQDVRAEFEKWYPTSELIEQYIEGLRKAGLDIPDQIPTSD
jgi:adenylate cyclase